MKQKIRYILLVVLTIIFVGSTGIIGYKYYSSWQNQKEVEKVREVVNNTIKEGDLHKTEQDYINDGINIVNKINQEYGTDKFSAYLTVGDNMITEPVVKATEPEQYLRSDIHGNYNIAGTIKVYYQNQTYEDDSVTLYGHSMLDNTRFGYLVSREDAMSQNNMETAKLYTNKGTYEYKLVDMRVIDNDRYFAPEKAITISGLNEMKSVPAIKTIKDGEIKEGHKYLTLLTCHGPVTERTVAVYELVKVNGKDTNTFN